MEKLKYDKDRLDFVEDKRTFGFYLRKVLTFLMYTCLLVILYALVSSLLITTKEQKRMVAETKLIEKEYDRILKESELLEEVVSELEVKDGLIYEQIFNTSLPDASFFTDSLQRADLDHLHGRTITSYTAAAVKRLEDGYDRCDSLIGDIMASLKRKEVKEHFSELPSILPIRNFPLGNLGASLGKKMHPFYKSMAFHSGLDLIASVGTEVVATADGTVSSVVRSKTSHGTRVEISHANGYSTSYSHLSDILVRKGQKVAEGTVIARVGNSGSSFAPHLHYEVLHDGKYQDPLNFFFGELDLEQYQETLLVSLNTGQSLD